MIKTPLSTAIGGVGFYTKNAVVIGNSHKSEPEPPFDPASLFENGEIGTLLDATDLSAIYQDAEGINIATQDKTVGLMLDKSKHIVKRRNLLTDTILSTGVAAFSTKGGNITTTNLNGKIVGKITNLAQTVDTYAYMRAPVSIGTICTFSVTLKAEDGAPLNVSEFGETDCRIVADGNAIRQELYSITTMQDGSIRVSATFTCTRSSSTCGVVKYKASINRAIFIYDYQIDLGTQASQYQAIDANNNWTGKQGAQQIDSAKKPLLQNNIKFDGIDDALNIAFPSALTSCTIFSVKHGQQAQILEAQSVAQNHVINQDFKYYGIVNRALTSAERANLTHFLNEVGAQ